ncbi:hypothetical protein OsJ_10697 [Oryza sativa Japonica Group]|uniref:GOLD domain-containing protein n=1 Tax=Oryza sativa subsp. japonica TaxID=39947 RepID=B9F891_ORYSJ|nr:hypothetical protein OsJ_10697 [Oryza sativa Japonica Group]
MTASRSLLAVILLAATAADVDALVFDVPSGGSKCLTEELRRGALSQASYRVAEAHVGGVLRGLGARGGAPRRGAAPDGGRGGRGVQWTTEVRDHAGGAGSPPAVAAAKEGHIDSMIGELKKLEVSTRLIHEEMISLRRSEGEMQKLNEDTTMKIHSFTLLSLAVCVGVAGLQLWHLKTFFQKRHIL